MDKKGRKLNRKEGNQKIRQEGNGERRKEIGQNGLGRKEERNQERKEKIKK